MSKRRNRQGGKVIDTQLMRAFIGSQQMTTSLGIVRKFPGETSHFDIDTENGSAEILVDVELIPSGERVLCRLGFGNDSLYKIPRVNQEVAVLIPFTSNSLIKDPLDYGAIIIGVLDNDVPEQLDSDDIAIIKTTRVRIISDDVKVGDPPEDATDPVIRKSDLASFISTYNAHTHAVPALGTSAVPVAQQSPINGSDVLKVK